MTGSGENPARFLDHDLIEHGEDHTDNTLQRMVRDRIRGIDTLEVIDAWIETETSLDRGPRQTVISWLNQRKRYLEEHGERPDLSTASLDERPDRYHPHRRDLSPADVTVEKADGEVVPWSQRPTGVSVGRTFESSTTDTEVATDGGESP
jgi:hypothetical protein